MTTIRDNPPASIAGQDELKLYQELYDDIVDNGGQLRFDDRYALAELAITLVEMNRCREDIRINGTMMELTGERGNPVTKRNPAVEILQRAQTHAKALFKEFKLTPMSRGRQPAGVENGRAEDGWGEV